MSVGIIAAMNEEMQEIKKIMNDIKEEDYNNLKFYKGKINSNDVILVECGIGKVNAARTTQVLIDRFNVENVINIGTACGISQKLNITDVVIADKLCQHDFDLTAFGHEKGYITGIGTYIDSDKDLISRSKEVMQSLDKNSDYNVYVATVASGDQFCTDKNMAKKINEEFGAWALEMEGASIAQVCKLSNVPFVVIRSISDCPNGNNNIDFNTYLQVASKRGASFLNELLK